MNRPLTLLCALATVALPRAAADTPAPRIQATAPIRNFRLPTFNDAGFRTAMLRAEEARVISTERIEVRGVDFTLFSGDAFQRVDTRVTCPLAIVEPAANVLSGPESVHVVRQDIEATGSDWRYDHKEQKITINRDARIIFQSEMKALLK